MKNILWIVILFSSYQVYGQNQINYTRIYGFSNGFARVEKNGKIGFIDTTLKEVIPCQFHWANDFNSYSNLASFMDTNKLFGYIDRAGETIVSPKYENVYFFHTNPDLVYVKRDGKYGWMDKNGHEVIPCIYEQTTSTPEKFYHGLVRMKKDGKYGILNASGEVVINFEYDYFIGFEYDSGFPKDFMAAKKGKKYYYIDMRTYQIYPTDFEYAGSFHEGVATVKKNDKYGYIDTSFNLIIPCNYTITRNFNEGLASVSNDNRKWGVINRSGDTIVNFTYGYIMEFEDGIAGVKDDDTQYGYINRKGKEITKISYDKSSFKNKQYHYKHIILCANSNCFLANKKGKRISKKTYSNLTFVDRFRLHTDVIINENYNYCLGVREDLFYAINKKGKEINKIGSLEMLFFYNELALVRAKNDKVGFINSRGKIVIPFDYEYYRYYHFINDYSILKMDGKLGMINRLGETIVPFEYDELNHFNNGFALGKRDNKYVLLNKSIEIVLESENLP